MSETKTTSANRFRFRAWDKNDKVMREVNSIDFVERTVHISQYYSNEMKWSEVEIMQSTGLTDKNGKEMWEGDILDGGHVIAWSRGRLIAHYITSHSIKGWDYSDEHETELYNEVSTVIGNVHEHPHLLPSL